ncbi:hypothetical protein DPMN_024792 [Dreissena polymorpha]|uniref:Uncharacterized protein n=2 Tax=Dreissena polymorpha TaxID=45954 RepID=A0A9D4RB31_DREPO|nr:hypothetical protein DPMN_024792 [Dreissena polymorpha]
MLIADILRESHIDEKKKASSTDIKLYDASRRRMCLNHIKEQATKSNICLPTADISERRQRVKEMAIAARRRAVEERGSNKPLAVACSIDR